MIDRGCGDPRSQRAVRCGGGARKSVQSSAVQCSLLNDRSKRRCGKAIAWGKEGSRVSRQGLTCHVRGRHAAREGILLELVVVVVVCCRRSQFEKLLTGGLKPFHIGQTFCD